MAWCPKCRNEYVDGITHCDDCNCDLVDKLEELTDYKYIYVNGYDDLNELVDYLHQTSITDAHVEFSKEDNCDVIAVPSKDYTDARIHLMVYIQNERTEKDITDTDLSADENSLVQSESNLEDCDSDSLSENSTINSNSDVVENGIVNTPINDDDNDYNANIDNVDSVDKVDSDSAKEQKEEFEEAVFDMELENDSHQHDFLPTGSSSGAVYVKLSDKYEDVKSSAYTLLVVGTIGLLALIMEIAGLYTLPFNTSTKPLFYFVFGGILIACIIGGFVSMMRATTLKQEADQEDQLIEEILNWFNENYDAQKIDSNIDLSERDELLYFNRYDLMKDLIMHQYEEASEGLVDSLIEKIYTELYEQD